MRKAFIAEARADLMLVFLVLLTLAGLTDPHTLQAANPADGLRYNWQPDTEYCYFFEYGVEAPLDIRIIRGRTLFTAQLLAPGEIPQGESSKGTGTGFVVSSDGYIITCEHVVKGANKITVTLGGVDYTARTIVVNKKQDLAIIKIDAKDLPAIALGDSQNVELAQEVRVVGYPLSDVLGNSIKITRGTVAGIMADHGGTLQVDASINPGNSGGPIVSEQGEVVGIASAKLTGDAVSNVGFGVPVNEARKMLTARNIKFSAIGAPARLEGPELAKRVVPSVALITVNSSGVLTGDHYRLVFRHRHEVNRSSYVSRTMPKGWQSLSGTTKSIDNSDGSVHIVNQYGETAKLYGSKMVPFGVGFLEQILVDPLSPDHDNQWEIERATGIPFTEELPSRSFNLPGSPDLKTVFLPAIERFNYEITSQPGDPITVIKKITELETTHKPSDRAIVKLSGVSNIKIDKQLGVLESLTFTGTCKLTLTKETVPAPVRFSLKRVPANTFKDPLPPPVAPGQLAKIGQPAPVPAAPAPAAPAPAPGNPAPAPGNGAPAPAVNINVPPVDPRAAAVPGVARQMVPGQAELQAAKDVVKEVFGEQITAAKTAAKKVAVVKKLLEHARQEKGTAANQAYALLDEAQALAVSAGDVGLAMQAIDALEARFILNGGQRKAQALTTLSETATSIAQHKAVATAALALFESAMAHDHMDTARTAGGIALAAARKSKDDLLAKQIADRGKFFKAKQTAYEKIPAALTNLQNKPDDGDANLTVGRYYCFFQENWRRGLPLLARSSDPKLQKLAQLELEGDSGLETRLEVADAWWQCGEDEPDIKLALQTHAAEIYRALLSDAAGLTKSKIEKRLSVLTATTTASPGTTANIAASNSAAAAAAEREATWKKFQEQVRANQVKRTTEAGFTLNKAPYAVIPEDGAILVGFDLSIGGRGIEAVCPLFQQRANSISGAVIGKATPGKILRVMAKKGYAVAGIRVKAGLRVDGLSVTFMEVKDGLTLDPATAYTSPWYGGNAFTDVILGDGTLVVGIHGHGQPGELSSIGLVQLGAEPLDN